MDFQAYLHKSWSEHAKNPQGVADQFEAHFQTLTQPEQIFPFAHLISHVFLEHLCDWAQGKQVLSKLQKLPLSENSETQSAMKRFIATMDYLTSARPDISAFSPSCQVRILAAAAGGFAAAKRISGAKSALQEAVSIAAQHLEEKDPAFKPLAMAGNNLASQLEKNEDRSAEETALMLFAAELARKFWELAATWLEVERAEYRLAHSELAAGNAEKAMKHANLCLEICQKNSASAMELFFALECFAKIYLQQNKRSEFAEALQKMEGYLGELNSDENPWCVKALNKLKARD